ncbi:hypothetical protein [Hyphomonas sp.]|uniref:hypothetical protein n=1 Tax=Hyphomonas sp. TaxID=87 RepID=UPI003002F6B4
MTIPNHVLATRKRLAGMEIECGETADRLLKAAEAVKGSEAIGYETMGRAFQQMSKVIRNYMAAVDREIEDRDPGAVQAFYAALVKMEKTHAEMQARPAEPEAKPEPEPVPDGITETLLEASLYQSDTPEKISAVLLDRFRVAKGAAEYARVNGVYEGRNAVYWERKAERYESALKWNRPRMAETLS